MDRRPPVRAALGNARLVRVLAAYAGSAIGEWALWGAVLVYAYDRGGPTIAGAASIGLLIPVAAVAPFAGRAADGAHPERVLLIVYVVEAAALTCAALLALGGAPLPVVVAAVGVAITSITFIRPSIAVVVPGLVVSPADLVAANLLTGNADSVSVLAGPLLASTLLVLDGPALVFGVCAGVSTVCAWLTFRLDAGPGSGAWRRSAPHRVASSSRTGALVGAARTMVGHRGSLPLLGVLGAQYTLVGALDLLVINLAFTVLDLGDAGPGMLSALFGVGAVVGGAASALIVGRRRLTAVMTACLGTIAASMLALGASTVIITTLLVLPVVGTARSLLDVSGRMLLQRCAPQDAVASVFVILEVLSGIGILFGSVLVQVLITHGGLRPALIGVSIFFVLVALLSTPGLRHVEEHADAPVVEIRLLRSTTLFSPLPGPVLEGLARASEMMEFDTGATIVREGEQGHHYFVIASGSVDVHVGATRTRRMSRPEGFGEIALLANLPRTATVTAREPVTVLAVERGRFLAAVTGHDGSASAAWAVARELHPPLTAQFDT